MKTAAKRFRAAFTSAPVTDKMRTIVSLCLAVPGLFADFFFPMLKVRDTKGVDLTKEKGDEWDQTEYKEK